MMSYDNNLFYALKIIHVVSASVLFGTGLGTAVYMWLANKTNNLTIMAMANRSVVRADWIFTGSSGSVQAITGLWMVYLKYSLMAPWVLGSILSYLIAGACWLPVVYYQIKLRDIAEQCLTQKIPLPVLYYRYFRRWFILGWPAFISLIIVFYLMTARPGG